MLTHSSLPLFVSAFILAMLVLVFPFLISVSSFNAQPHGLCMMVLLHNNCICFPCILSLDLPRNTLNFLRNSWISLSHRPTTEWTLYTKV